jgi:cellulose synthase operon protein C
MAALRVVVDAMGEHAETAQRARARTPRLCGVLVCALLACEPEPPLALAPFDVELHGYDALAEIDGEIHWVLGDSLVLRVPAGAHALELTNVEEGRRREITLSPPEVRGEYALVRAELDRPLSGDLVLRDARGAAIRSWPLAQDSALPAELAAILERGDDSASAPALQSALARLAPREKILALVELARIAERVSDIDAVIAAWDRASAAAHGARVPTEASRCLRAAAYHALHHRRYPETLERLERSEAIDRPLGHTLGIVRSARYAALVAQARGDYRDAVQYLESAADDAWSRGLDTDLGWIATTLSLLLVDLGRYDEALGELERAAPTMAGGDEATRFAFEINLGWVSMLGMEHGAFEWDLERPRRSFDRARRLARALRRRDFEANAISNLLWVAYLDADDRRARSLLREFDALDPRRESSDGRFADIVDGRLRLDDGDLAGALSAMARARERALDETEGLESEYSWRALYGTAEVLHRSGDSNAARIAIDDAIEAVIDIAMRTDMRDARAALLRDRSRLFADGVGWSLDAGDTSRAFEIAEIAHTHLLRGLESAVRTARLSPVERARFEMLRERYLSAREAYERGASERDLLAGAELQSFEVRRAAEREALSALFARVYAYLDEVAPIAFTPPSAESVSRALAGDEALVTVVALGAEHVSFLVRSGRVSFRWLDAPSSALDVWSAELEGVAHLYVVAASPDAGARKRARDAAARPWLDRFGISYLTHASLVERDRSYPHGRALVVADPDDDLPGARREARRAAEDLDRPAQLSSGEVTREALLDGIDGARFFHFAGHGELEEAQPWDSHLDLADAETLALEDVLVARPNVGAIVLSGCETADVTRAESIGIADAFVLAGARTVIAADGALADAPAREFVEAFYDAGGASDPMGAYRRAALDVLARGGELRFRALGLRPPRDRNEGASP